MAWTASIANVEKQPGVILVTVRYTDGAKAFDETYKSFDTPSVDWIPNTTKSKIAVLNGVDTASISVGAIPEPSTVDEKYQEFLQKLRKLDVITKLISIGAIAPNDVKVTAFVNSLKTDLAAYWSQI